MSGLAVVAEAKKYINKSSQYDCFEFVNFIYKKVAGINDLKRGFSCMLVAGTKVTKELKPGDLIVQKVNWNLGIYIGNDTMVLAPRNRGDIPRITSLPNYSYEVRRIVNK